MKFIKLPTIFQNENVERYYNILKRKKISFLFKGMFDFFVSLIMILVLSPVFLILAILIKCSSKGPVIYKQVRITKYNRKFKIWKFRTMVVNADKIGNSVTVGNDSRITKIGKFLRKYRLDELPQLFNILFGQMSFVGPRPEVVKYVDKYSDEMLATLLVRAGVTCPASIKFKDEAEMLKDVVNVDEAYVNDVLPKKMEYNYEYLNKFSFFYDIKILFATVLAVFR